MQPGPPLVMEEMRKCSREVIKRRKRGGAGSEWCIAPVKWKNDNEKRDSWQLKRDAMDSRDPM